VPGRLTVAGAPKFAPYMLRGGNDHLGRRAFRAAGKLKSVKGTVSAG
jgi:hypothetical protein